MVYANPPTNRAIADVAVLNKRLKKKVICEFKELLAKARKGYRINYEFILEEISFIDLIKNNEIEDRLSLTVLQYYLNNSMSNTILTPGEDLDGWGSNSNPDLEAKIEQLTDRFENFLSANNTDAIDNYNEVLAFLNNIKDSERLTEIVKDVQQDVVERDDKIQEGIDDLFKGDKTLVTPTIVCTWELQDSKGNLVENITKNPLDLVYGYTARIKSAYWYFDTKEGQLKEPQDQSSNILNWSVPLKNKEHSSEYNTTSFSNVDDSKLPYITVSAPKEGLEVKNGKVVKVTGETDNKTASVHINYKHRVYYGAVDTNDIEQIIQNLENLTRDGIIIEGMTENNYNNGTTYDSISPNGDIQFKGDGTNKYYLYAYPEKLGVLTHIHNNGNPENQLGSYSSIIKEITTDSGSKMDYVFYITNKPQIRDLRSEFKLVK